MLHGIDLTLKALLRHKGVSVRDLQRKFGHDLHACHRKAKELGLNDVFMGHLVDADAMRMLVGLNVQQGLRYIKTETKYVSLWSINEHLAVRLRRSSGSSRSTRAIKATNQFWRPPSSRLRQACCSAY